MSGIVEYGKFSYSYKNDRVIVRRELVVKVDCQEIPVGCAKEANDVILRHSNKTVARLPPITQHDKSKLLRAAHDIVHRGKPKKRKNDNRNFNLADWRGKNPIKSGGIAATRSLIESPADADRKGVQTDSMLYNQSDTDSDSEPGLLPRVQMSERNIAALNRKVSELSKMVSRLQPLQNAPRLVREEKYPEEMADTGHGVNILGGKMAGAPLIPKLTPILSRRPSLRRPPSARTLRIRQDAAMAMTMQLQESELANDRVKLVRKNTVKEQARLLAEFNKNVSK
jgi:hypothetical protein